MTLNDHFKHKHAENLISRLVLVGGPASSEKVIAKKRFVSGFRLSVAFEAWWGVGVLCRASVLEHIESIVLDPLKCPVKFVLIGLQRLICECLAST